MVHPPLTEEVTLEVPFHDVDAMGVVWHGNYPKYLELARTALTRRMGRDLHHSLPPNGLLWPVVVCNLKYIRPLRYAQRVRVQASLVEWESRLKVNYVLRDDATGQVTTKATTIQVAVDASTGELQFQIPSSCFPSLETRS